MDSNSEGQNYFENNVFIKFLRSAKSFWKNKNKKPAVNGFDGYKKCINLIKILTSWELEKMLVRRMDKDTTDINWIPYKSHKKKKYIIIY